MTERPAKNVAASVRQRLLNVRDTQGGDYNALLTQYAIERFLYRLSKSELADDFVLKGAMLFRVWSGALHRATKDLDLLGRGDPSPDAVAETIRRIAAAPVEDDGMMFDPSSVEARRRGDVSAPSDAAAAGDPARTVGRIRSRRAASPSLERVHSPAADRRRTDGLCRRGHRASRTPLARSGPGAGLRDIVTGASARGSSPPSWARCKPRGWLSERPAKQTGW